MIIFINAFIENEYLFVINAFIVNEHKYLSWSHAAPIPPSSEEIAQEVVNPGGGGAVEHQLHPGQPKLPDGEDDQSPVLC